MIDDIPAPARAQAHAAECNYDYEDEVYANGYAMDEGEWGDSQEGSGEESEKDEQDPKGQQSSIGDWNAAAGRGPLG